MCSTRSTRSRCARSTTTGGRPVYAVVPGWLTSIAKVNSLDALPVNAKALVSLIEREVGIPISIVGTGAERDSYVTWHS